MKLARGAPAPALWEGAISFGLKQLAGLKPGGRVDLEAANMLIEGELIDLQRGHHPPPVVPRDLLGHNCINTRHSMTSGLYAWEFSKDGEEVRVRVDGQVTLNASLPTIAAALDGHGIAYVPEDLVAEHISGGAAAASAG